MVNPFQQDCFEYFVLNTLEDVRIDVDGFNGQADLYIVPWITPTGPDSSNIVLRAAHGSNRGIILADKERKQWSASTGSYSICFYAYTPFSAQVTIQETEMGTNFDVIDGQIRTQQIEPNGWISSNYKNVGMTRAGKIEVYLENQNLLDSEDANTLQYKICSGSGCFVDQENKDGNGFYALPPGCTQIDKKRNCAIDHDPTLCPGGDTANCGYIFSITNQLNKWSTVSFRVASKFQDPGDVELKKTYANELNEGQYFFYELNPATNSEIMPYLKELKIKLEAKRGDADLFATTD